MRDVREHLEGPAAGRLASIVRRSTDMIGLAELVRRTTAAGLEGVGYTVVAASSPAEALAFCERSELAIDVVLTDVVMPGMSGKELSDRLASLRPGLKVVFMSGYTSNVIAHHGILDSAVHFISKPFCIGDLARKLREVLAGN
jgi:two-component system, cell cycle sensor histidine kinase and response regulator CckA